MWMKVCVCVPKWQFIELDLSAAIGPIRAMKVDIQQVHTISCDDGKAIAIPANLLQEHDGQLWLKLRPTSQPINQMVYGKVGKNASFSNHVKFQDFIAKRSQVCAKAGNTPPEEVFPEQDQPGPKPPTKKRKLLGTEIVEVPLDDHKIQCLMKGHRPTKSDLVVPLQAHHLEPIFAMLKEDPEGSQTRKTYQKKEKEPKEEQVPKHD